MVGLAVAIFGVAAIADTLADLLIHDLIEERGETVLISLLAGPVSINSAALVLFAGMLDRLVGHHLHGHEKPALLSTFATLPWGRLLVADAAFLGAVSIGMALAVVPGLVIFTIWCLIGPVINIEGGGLRASFHRCLSLVRPHFWLVFLLVTLPVTVEVIALHSFHFIDAERPLLAAFVVSGAIGAVVGASIGLVEVVLAHKLLAE